MFLSRFMFRSSIKCLRRKFYTSSVRPIILSHFYLTEFEGKTQNLNENEEHNLSALKKDEDNVEGNLSKASASGSSSAQVDDISNRIAKNFNNFRKLIKILARNDDDVKIDEKNAKILLLDGLTFLNQLASGAPFHHFTDYYPIWWKHFSSNVDHFDAESLCTTIDLLGSINCKTTGLLRMVATDEHMQLLISNILKKDFLNLSPASINKLYSGLTDFGIKHTNTFLNPLSASPSAAVERESYPGKNLINKTIEWINKYQTNDEKFYDTTNSCCFVAERLSVLDYKKTDQLDDDLIKLIVDLSKMMFDLNSKLTKELSDAVDLSVMVVGQLKFAHAFLKLRRNFTFVDDANEAVWATWLGGAKNLMQIYSQSNAFMKMVEVSNVKRNTNKMSTLIASMCSLTLKIALTFNKMNVFAELKPVWSRLLRSCLASANRRALNELISTLRDVETNVDAKKIMDNKSDEKDTSTEELWDMFMKELDRFGEKYKFDEISTIGGGRKDFAEKDIERLKQRYGTRLKIKKPITDDDHFVDDFQFKKSRDYKSFVQSPRKSFVPQEIEEDLKKSKSGRNLFDDDEPSTKRFSQRSLSSPGQRTSRGGGRSAPISRTDDDFDEEENVPDDDDDEEERVEPTDRRERNRELGGRRFGSEKYEVLSKRGADKHFSSKTRFGNANFSESPTQGRSSRRSDVVDDDEDFDEDDQRKPASRQFDDRRRNPSAISRRATSSEFFIKRPQQNQKKFSRNKNDDYDADERGDDDPSFFQRGSAFKPSRFNEQDSQVGSGIFRKRSSSGYAKRPAADDYDDDDQPKEFRHSKFRPRSGSAPGRNYGRGGGDDSY